MSGLFTSFTSFITDSLRLDIIRAAVEWSGKYQFVGLILVTAALSNKYKSNIQVIYSDTPKNNYGCSHFVITLQHCPF